MTASSESTTSQIYDATSTSTSTSTTTTTSTSASASPSASSIVEELDNYQVELDVLTSDDYDTTAMDDFYPQEGLAWRNNVPDSNKRAPEIIAETLASLPMHQREQILREIHGIDTPSLPTKNSNVGAPQSTNYNNDSSNNTDEPPEFVQERLHAMEQELQRLTAANEGTFAAWWTSLRLAALEMAQSQNLAYVQDPQLRLRFLRCERWNATKAASRLIRHLDWKLELFGEAKLTHTITLDDLEPEDLHDLKQGYAQRLPVRDRAGRAVLVFIFQGQRFHSQQSFARQFFYLGMQGDEETDKRGTVVVSFKLADFGFVHYNKHDPFRGLVCTAAHRMLSDMPFRIEANHKCLEDESQSLVAKLINLLVDKGVNRFSPELQARTKTHYGSYNDWIEALMAYGIPHDLIPLTYDYKVKTKNHLDYLAMRKKAESLLSSNSTVEAIDLPSRRDVLLGKGKPIQFHSGNLALSNIIDEYLDQYHNKSSKIEKTALAAEIVRKVKTENNVRFLTKASGIWIIVSDDIAREKVSHMFRHQRHRTTNNNDNMGKHKSSYREPSSTTASKGSSDNDLANSDNPVATIHLNPASTERHAPMLRHEPKRLKV